MTEAAKPAQGECLALADQACSHCFGLGRVEGRNGRARPCKCVYRAIFRVCYARFRDACRKEGHISRVSMEAAGPKHKGGKGWGMKNEEYAADFVLVSQRVLRANELGLKIFKFHFLYGANWRLCAAKLGIDRGAFFHEVYRIEAALGRAYSELEPYALFPVDAYFASTRGRDLKAMRAA